jgi:transcriptional accessory protein Tex/SPT6
MKNTNVELTTKKGSYVENLVAHEAEINKAYSNYSIKTPQFMSLVESIVVGTNTKDLEHKSQATKRFLMYLRKQRTKDGIMTLVWNARLKGDGLGVL